MWSTDFTGNEAANIFYGSKSDDKFDGGAGDDQLFGGDGHDTFVASAGKDLFDGGNGTDSVDYSKTTRVQVLLDHQLENSFDASDDEQNSIENLVGSQTGDDVLGGNGSINYLQGLGGDDILYAIGGHDFFDGGEGRDKLDYYYETQSISLALASGPNPFYPDGLNYAISNLYDAVRLIEDIGGSNIGSDFLYGNELANEIFGYGGNDNLNGGDGDDEIDGGDGDDILAGDGGDDSLAGGLGNDSLNGNAGIDILFGDNGSDNLNGNAGDDILFGGAGHDKIFGSSGDDSLEGGQGGDLLNGGAGQDIADYGRSSGVTASLANHNINTGDATSDQYVSIEGIAGSDFGNDRLIGNKAFNILLGNGGNDKLFGMAGNDILSGGAGADLLDGGKGNDTADYFTAGSIKVSLDGSFTSTGIARGDKFISVENLIGSADGSDKLAGNSDDNYIAGFGGNDKLYGRGGSDVLEGGSRNDVLVGGSGADYFYFGSLSSGADKLSDFGRNDFVVLSEEAVTAERIGANLDMLDLEFMRLFFQAGATNIAKDNLKVFLYRTTDSTFWFDKDGAGFARPVLIATLPDHFKLTVQDILVV
jgi:Ca2+-binding RTX toxin-like protein